MKELALLKECYSDILKSFKLKNVCLLNKFQCFGILVSTSMYVVFWEQYRLISMLFLVVLVLFIVWLIKAFDKKLYSSVEAYHQYRKNFLDYKFQKLLTCVEKKKIDIEKVYSLLEEEVNINQFSIIEKNPIFVVSFAILLAVMSTGDLDALVLNFFFIIAVLGIIFSFLLNDLFVWNKDKELLFLVKMILNERDNK